MIENSRPEAAQSQPYTCGLTHVAFIALAAFTFYDLGHARSLSLAFGIENTIWICVCMVAGWLISAFCIGVVGHTYTRRTGLLYTSDREGFVKSGGSDIGFWSGFCSLIGTLYIFARFVPTGVLGGFHPFVVLLIAVVVACMLAKMLANMVFSTLYGPASLKVF
jgi:hypothetical protein